MTDAIGPGEAARRLGVTTRTVQRWLREGKLPAVQVGSRLKVDAIALRAGCAARQLVRRRLRSPWSTSCAPIRRLLVANRGELVVRIARTCRQLGIQMPRARPRGSGARVVDAPGGRGRAASRRPTSTPDAVLLAARQAGADAIHPGYGFLAENADFAEAVIGGRARLGRAAGGRPCARSATRPPARDGCAASVDVPVLPGYDGDDQSDTTLAARGEARSGIPVLVKPSAGGGGKGMHVVACRLRTSRRRSTTARREASACLRR